MVKFDCQKSTHFCGNSRGLQNDNTMRKKYDKMAK